MRPGKHERLARKQHRQLVMARGKHALRSAHLDLAQPVYTSLSNEIAHGLVTGRDWSYNGYTARRINSQKRD